MPPRVAFVTVGQTPRADLVPELLAWMGGSVEAHEVGALDGLEEAEIAALAPAAGQPRFVTRLGDGRQAVVRREWAHRRVAELVAGLDDPELRAVVVLCTGAFPGLRAGPLLVGAYPVVDHGVAALGAGARRLGLLVPLAEQAGDVHLAVGAGQEVVVAHASPYVGDRFAEAGRALADTDLVVMHCMGYTEAQRDRVARASGRPVLLARRLVGAALAQLA